MWLCTGGGALHRDDLIHMRSQVRPGPDGYAQFTDAIRRAFSLPDDSELNITFTCDEPTAVEPLAPLPVVPVAPPAPVVLPAAPPAQTPPGQLLF